VIVDRGALDAIDNREYNPMEGCGVPLMDTTSVLATQRKSFEGNLIMC
jgi:hypothetical protein